jgi:hypothetical protein
MELKKIKINNSRFYYIPHQGKFHWTNTLGKILVKLEKESPFVYANPSYQILVSSPEKILVGREVMGPMREDIPNQFIVDFKSGEVETGEIYNLEISFLEVMELANQILEKRNDLNRLFSIRVSQGDLLSRPLEMRFFPLEYPIPKLTF